MKAKEYLKTQFLMGFKKRCQGEVTMAHEFVMPSFTIKDKQAKLK
jgi:hypothetical protein